MTEWMHIRYRTGLGRSRDEGLETALIKTVEKQGWCLDYDGRGWHNRERYLDFHRKELVDKPDAVGCWWMWTSRTPPCKTIFYVEERGGRLMASDGTALWDFDDPRLGGCIGWERIVQEPPREVLITP